MDNNVVLTMRGICKEFPGVRALHNVDFTLRSGEIHALMGENEPSGQINFKRYSTGAVTYNTCKIYFSSYCIS